MVGKKKQIKEDYNRTAKTYNRRYGPIQYGKFNILNGLNMSETVVDLGGGSGLLGRYLSRDDLINIDMSFEMLRESDEVNVCGDFDFIPLKSHCCDAVLSFTAVQNLPDFLRVFCEVRRILKPDGMFVCSALNKELDAIGLVKEAKLAGFKLKIKGLTSEDVWFVFV